MSERTSDWPSIYVPILGCSDPLWNGSFGEMEKRGRGEVSEEDADDVVDGGDDDNVGDVGVSFNAANGLLLTSMRKGASALGGDW